MSNDKLIITINRKTPTVNHLWGFRGFNRYLKTEGKEFVNYINNTIPTQIKDINYEELKKTELKVEVNIYENWYTKKGLVARKDADNRVKFLMDKVFDCININDKFIFELVVIKKQSTMEEKTIICIEKMEGENKWNKN